MVNPAFVARKMVHTLLVLLLASLAISSMLDLAPGDPAHAILGEQASPEEVEALHEQLGLDRPFVERYGDWVTDVGTGDLGTSYYQREKVLTLIWDAVPVTAELLLLTLLVALAISVPIAVYSAKHVGRRFDRATSAVATVFQASPAFVIVPALVFLLAVEVSVFPASGWVKLGDDPIDNLHHMALPVITLALTLIPIFVAVLRSDMISTLQQDFILNARAKGLSERTVLFRYALRPSSLSLVTMTGIATGALIGGAVVVEVLFSLPGIGTLTVSAINNKDVPIVQGVVMFIAIFYVALNVLIDITYSLLDPRVRTRAS